MQLKTFKRAVRLLLLSLIAYSSMWQPTVALDKGAAASGSAADVGQSIKGQAAFDTLNTMNTKLFPLYDKNIQQRKQHILDTCPVIIASIDKFILYRPGHPPLERAQLPATFTIVKNASHSALSTYEILAPYISEGSDSSWLQPLSEYRGQVRKSLQAVDSLNVTSEQRALVRHVLSTVLSFQDKCIAQKSFTENELNSMARGLGPDFLALVDIGAAAQVTHWYGVLAEWKKMLGDDWSKVYAITDSHFVTRQNNIIFSILVQFMGEQTINDRLLLLQSDGGENSPALMLDSLARTVSDRELSECFFNDKFMMDSDLLGAPARKAIVAESEKRGLKPLLPPLVPYKSHEWPWRIDPTSGTGAAQPEDLKF